MPPSASSAPHQGPLALVNAVRQNGVTYARVLKALQTVDRSLFVPPDLAHRAWEDTALPIGLGQTISQPSVVGFMTQAMDLAPEQRVLEVGTGSGYQTAILAHLVTQIYTVERIAAHARIAASRFARLGLHTITARVGDGTLGWPAQAPFDRIMVTAAGADTPPQSLTDQLAVNGILMIPLGNSPSSQRLVKIRKTSSGLHWHSLWPVRFVPLIAGDPVRE